jgi:hypothetical protein
VAMTRSRGIIGVTSCRVLPLGESADVAPSTGDRANRVSAQSYIAPATPWD